MSSLIDCPSCRRQLRVPKEFLGKSVRCPSCGETFRSPEPAAVAAPGSAVTTPAPSSEGAAPLLTVPIKLELDDEPPAPRPAAPAPAEEAPPRRRREPEPDDEDDRPARRRRRRREFEPCPRCREDIRRGTVVCPYCGLDLEEQGDGYTRRPPVRLDAEPHRGGLIQVLGILSLVLSLVYFLFFISLPLGIAAWVMGRGDLRKMEDGVMDPNGRRKTKDGWLCGIIGTILSSLCGLACVMFTLMIISEGSRPRPAPPPPPPAFAPQPGFAPPPVQQPRANNFSLRTPAPITLKRGEKKAVTVLLDRVPNFRGDVVVKVLDADELDDLDFEPDEVTLQGAESLTIFTVTADPDADAGAKVVRIRASGGAGEQVVVQLRVTVVNGR